jgi:hypothetical protein
MAFQSSKTEEAQAECSPCIDDYAEEALDECSPCIDDYAEEALDECTPRIDDHVQEVRAYNCVMKGANPAPRP